jgi:hypothetical protein
MRRIAFAIAAAAVIAAIAPAYAAEHDTCQVAGKQNWVKCVFQNAKSGGD